MRINVVGCKLVTRETEGYENKITHIVNKWMSILTPVQLMKGKLGVQ